MLESRVSSRQRSTASKRNSRAPSQGIVPCMTKDLWVGRQSTGASSVESSPVCSERSLSPGRALQAIKEKLHKFSTPSREGIVLYMCC